MTDTKIGCLLKREGGITQVSLPINIDLDNYTFEVPFESRGTGSPVKLGDWLSFDDVILMYGWTHGRAGQENKHEIPPPFDTNLYFGDILCLRLDDNGHLDDLTKQAYDHFQEMAMGGFTDLESGDDEIEHNKLEPEEIEQDDDSDYQQGDESSEESDSDSEVDDHSDSEGELEEEPDSDIVDWSEESGDSREMDDSDSASMTLSDEEE